jgi:hypothetical protein
VLRDRVASLKRLRGPRELLVLGEVLALAPAVPLLLRLPLPALRRVLTRGHGARLGLADERVEAVVEVAQALAHPVVRRGCLTRAITLFWLARRPGDELWFGIGGEADGFGGHCWLERDGRPHLEPLDVGARFVKQYAIA